MKKKTQTVLIRDFTHKTLNELNSQQFAAPIPRYISKNDCLALGIDAPHGISVVIAGEAFSKTQPEARLMLASTPSQAWSSKIWKYIDKKDFGATIKIKLEENDEKEN